MAMRMNPHSRRIVKVAQFGLGPIGIESIKLLATKPWAQVVGGIDIDPTKAGKTLADLGAGPGQPMRQAKVFESFAQLWSNAKPDVVLHTAGSKIIPTIGQILPIVSEGVSVLSSCEELLFPYHRALDESRELDRVCRDIGARVVGTGVNPGFVMDVLPVCMTGVSRRVDSLYIERVVNASTRRMPLQKKIGSGMDPAEFRALFAAGKAGHAGFQESAALVAHCLGWEPDEIVENCEPVVAERDICTDHFHVKPGQTCGLHQDARVIIDGVLRIVMDLKMYLDAPNPHDGVKVKGEPSIDLTIEGGVAGDHATVAALVNTIPRLLKVQPGLHLMTDLPVPAYC